MPLKKLKNTLWVLPILAFCGSTVAYGVNLHVTHEDIYGKIEVVEVKQCSTDDKIDEMSKQLGKIEGYTHDLYKHLLIGK